MSCRGCYKAVQKYLKKRLVNFIHPKLEVRMAKLGNSAGLHGVGCIAVEETISRLLKKTESEMEPD